MIWVFDKDLHKIGIIDNYTSLIWARRYKEVGDFEIYLPASVEILNLCKIGNYVEKDGSPMICRIDSVSLSQKPEEGYYITVTGKSAEALLDQRIIMETSICNGSAEEFALKLISSALGADASPERKIVDSDGILIFTMIQNGFPETLKEQVTYKNLGEKIREYCQSYGWGYKIEREQTYFVFSFYKGEDRSDSVVFSPNFENVSTSEYSRDASDIQNFVLCAGEGEGDARIKETVGTATGANRYEVFADCKQLSKTIRFSEIVSAYPNGTISQSGEKYYYSVSGVIIAEVPSASPSGNDECKLTDAIYSEQLIARGEETIANKGEIVTFDSTIIPNVTFIFGEDYFLGDIVRIENEFGISANARIIEIVEVEDENGYSIDPKFEYIEVE